MRLIDEGMRDAKYIRADLFMHRIANETLFSPADLTLIKFVMEQELGEDVKPVAHAHWIDQKHEVYKCSNCGNFLDFHGVNAGRGDANYCPNCGARMDEHES